MKIDFDLAGLKAAMATERAKVQAATRPAAQAAAQVIYDEARRLAPVSPRGHWFYGTSYKKTGQKYWFEGGSLRASIYQAFSKDNSTDSRAVYHVSWNDRKAPYAGMVEHGTSRAPAHPFMRPAIINKTDEALAAMKRTFVEKLDDR